MKIKHIIVWLFLVSFIIYFNSLFGTFIADDNGAIFVYQDTKTIFGLFNEFMKNLYNYNPFFFHLENVLSHCINGVLVFLFLNVFFKKEASFLGALTFICLPINTEAVSWISGRAYLNLVFFVLIIFLLYDKAVKKQSIDYFYYFMAFLLFLFYLGAFPLATPAFFGGIIFLFILTDWYFERVNRTKFLWLPFLAILAIGFILKSGEITQRIASILGYSYQHYYLPQIMIDTFIEGDWHNSWAIVPFSITYNFWVMVYPKLSFYYDNLIIDIHIFKFVYWGIILGVLTLIYYRRKPVIRLILFIFGFFCISLLPTLSPLPLCSIVQERYLYFSSITLAMINALSYEYTKNKKVFYYLLIPFLVMGIYRIVIRNSDYRSQIAFFKQATITNPQSDRAFLYLGTSYAEAKYYDKAIENYIRAMEINHFSDLAMRNLVLAYEKKGLKVKGLKFLKRTGKWEISLIPLRIDKYGIIIEEHKDNKNPEDEWRHPGGMLLDNTCLAQGKTMGECYDLEVQREKDKEIKRAFQR